MGFTDFERDQFRATCRTQSKIDFILENYYPEDLIEFLRQENHLRRSCDYSIMRKFPKIDKPEQIIMTYLLDPETTLYDILTQWDEFLSPPVN